MRKGSKALLASFRRLLDDKRGSTAGLLAVAAVPVIGMAGVGIDSGRGYILHQRMSQALDAAALAGGRAMYSSSRDQDVSRFFFANIPADFMGAKVNAPTIQVGANQETITLVATAELPSTFTKVLGVDIINVEARTVVRRANRGLELVMALDTTGSMQDNNKIGALKDAANQLVDILYGAQDTAEKLYVGLAPYTTSVNIGPARTAWLTGYNPAAYSNVSWRGCVEARSGQYEDVQADAPPSTAGFKPYFYPSTYGQTWYYGGKKITNSYVTDNSWQLGSASSSYSGNGPNKYCQVASKAEILPLQDSKAKVKQAITAMTADSIGTLTNVGLAWGWRMLSPNWRGLWGSSQQWGTTTPATLPLDYNTPGMDKALILLTDGLTNMPAGSGQNGCNGSTPAPDGNGNQAACSFPYGSYTAFGRLSDAKLGTVQKSVADNRLNTRILNTCNAMKAQGIKIYTIVLDTTDTNVQDLFRSCATAPDYYYNSPSASDLAGVFQKIALQLSQLRLEQ